MRFSTVFNRYAHTCACCTAVTDDNQITTDKMLAPSHINTDGRSSLILFLRIAAQGKPFMSCSSIWPHTSHPICQLAWLGIRYYITHVHTGECDPIGDSREQFHEKTGETVMVKHSAWPDQWIAWLPAYIKWPSFIPLSPYSCVCSALIHLDPLLFLPLAFCLNNA